MNESAKPQGHLQPVKVVKVPRFGRFIFVGFLVGALLGMIITLVFPETDPDMAPRKYVFAFAMLGLGGLVAAITALVMVLRYRDRAEHAATRATAERVYHRVPKSEKKRAKLQAEQEAARAALEAEHPTGAPISDTAADNTASAAVTDDSVSPPGVEGTHPDEGAQDS